MCSVSEEMPPDLIPQNSCLSGLATTARWRLAAEAAEAAVGVEKADSSRDDVDWSMVDLPLLKVGTQKNKDQKGSNLGFGHGFWDKNQVQRVKSQRGTVRISSFISSRKDEIPFRWAPKS